MSFSQFKGIFKYSHFCETLLHAFLEFRSNQTSFKIKFAVHINAHKNK